MEINTKFQNNDDLIQVIDDDSNAWSIIRDITQSGYQEDAFYICDISDIIHQYKNWKLTMPRVESHYAVKCNNSKIVLEVLAAFGLEFDCASQEEISQVLSLGVDPERIIFANPTKKASHIKYAAKMGVKTMTFDNENELHKIKRYYPTARLVIRIKYDDLTAKYILGNKYGCDHETEAPELLRVARSLNLNVIGVSFHIGSGSKNRLIYSEAIAAARYVFDVAAEFGYNFNLLDIGGGFPEGRTITFKEVGKDINSALDIYFPDPCIRIISEPGRYYAGSAYTLVSNIHSTKTVHDTDDKKIQMYYVDISIYGALISVLCDEVYRPSALNKNLKNQKYKSIVWGATCDGFDKIAENVMLPELKIGDWIIFETAGAYTITTASQFNGFPTPKVHCIINRNDWQLLQQLDALPKDRFVVENTIDNLFTGLLNLR